jgi:hypothetical protein
VSIGSGVVGRRLYIFHHLEPKDENLPTQMIKRPIRIMDFNLRKMFEVDYLNDDSTGTIRGDETDKRATILPSSARVNYSICEFKNKVYIYGGVAPQTY